MSQLDPLRTLSDQEVAVLTILPAGPVNLRRDVYQFVTYVETFGLTRTFRENAIPKAAARKLAKLLSYEEEAREVEEEGRGFWSDKVSHIARHLGLVSFDIKGDYQGYSSTSESYPDNHIVVNAKAWSSYLSKTPRQKEQMILDALIRETPNEFFSRSTLAGREVFDSWGSALGPASRMKLPQIRSGLLSLLAQLSPNVWYETRDVVEWIRMQAPMLILDPATRGPDDKSADRLGQWEYENKWKKKGPKSPQPEVKLEDIYVNFREFDPPNKEHGYYQREKPKQITSRTPDAFHRVEGRYFEWFLSEVPYLAGFVDLAYRSEKDHHGRDVFPPFEQLRAFRLTPWFFLVMGSDPELDRVNVTAMPNFEVLIDAPSYPDRALAALAPYTVLIGEDGPVHRVRLDRKKVVETAASNSAAPAVAEVLQELAGKPLPGNVAAELDAWTGHAGKLTFYEGMGLLELRGDAAQRQQVLDDLQGLVADDRLEGFVLIREPGPGFDRLEQRLHVPLRVLHPEMTFAREVENLRGPEPTKPREKAAPAKARPMKVQLQSEDLVGLRSSNYDLLIALWEALQKEPETCLRAGDDLLVLSATAMPKVRTALRRLSDRFDVEV
jgi:hypothetical protein